jgi:hypothetical protein
VANGLPGTTTNEIRTETIQLPAGKTSETAVLQWMWASRSDGGFYIGCSDIKISSAIPTAPPTPLAVLPTPAPGPVVTPDDDYLQASAASNASNASACDAHAGECSATITPLLCNHTC